MQDEHVRVKALCKVLLGYQRWRYQFGLSKSLISSVDKYRYLATEKIEEFMEEINEVKKKKVFVVY